MEHNVYRRSSNYNKICLVGRPIHEYVEVYEGLGVPEHRGRGNNHILPIIIKKI